MSAAPKKRQKKTPAGSRGWLGGEQIGGEMFVRVSSLYPYSSDPASVQDIVRLHPAYS